MRVDATENFYRIRIREPRQFSEMRIPEWAHRVAESVIKNAKITIGKKGKEWKVQSILIPRKGVTKAQALRYAKQILKKIEYTKGLVW